MFLGPYEQGGDFRDATIAGTRRFLDRLWATVSEATSDGGPDTAVMSKLHRTIQKVGEDLPRLSYNTAVAALMEYMNAVRENERVVHKDEVEPLVLLTAPFAPHVAEELWERLGHSTSVFDAGWPVYDPAAIADATITLAVQVNGKLRTTLVVPPDITQDQAVELAIADPAVARHLLRTRPKKVIFVPKRLLNLVVAGGAGEEEDWMTAYRGLFF
jgi:leucyl-tRNA synthetase